MEQSREIQGPSDDPITREIQRISGLSCDRLMSEVVQMATNWLVEHVTDLSGDDGISGHLAIAKAYQVCLIKALVESTRQTLEKSMKQGEI